MRETDVDEPLLAHLARSKHEDIAVEALGFILRSGEARKVLEKALKDEGADVRPIDRFRTQAQVGGQGRPDLVGFGGKNKDDERVLIEAKFWAGLTDKQPEAYLERLREGVLLFVAPASRVEALWSELCRRAEVRRPPPSPEKVDVKSVRIDDRKLLMLISWTHLLDRLKSGDRHSGAEIQQLRGLAEWMDDQEEFPPLRLEELAPETPRRLRGLWRLLNDAIEQAKDPGTAHAGFVVRGSHVRYGQWLLQFKKGAATSHADAQFGIDFDRWAQEKYPDTPVWLEFYKFGGPVAKEQWPKTRRALEEWLGRKDPPECFHEGDRILVPVELETGVGYDVVLNAVAKRLRDVACRIAPEGRTAAQG